MNEDFAQNLRLLCSYHKSIAEVCRRLEINRPQFNRYLSGRYKPSANTLRRLCDFFGVEVHEILLPHDQFQRLVQVRPSSAPVAASPNDIISEHVDHLCRSGSSGLDRYLGYYFEYYLSMSTPGKLIRTLISIEKRDGHYVFQRTERMQPEQGQPACHNRYQGAAVMLSDRLFLVDYETLNRHELTQTILFPSFRNRLTRLTGLRIGVSDNSERMPCCTRVLYEFLGTSVRVRKALAMCGLIEPDSQDLDPAIVAAVQNDMSEDEIHFRARHHRGR
ncbi:helix-turn-helix transcriptional regulator [Marinobacterium sediminicola]|uniref:Helix-turn-helix domain-containing protein n=1 Tax=Marinobacterium sediminicola TaxID=518898 RepID=A0ABY1RW94_9GAMM|nr:helix-turn-helix transcriptional regulator [Marinobacterium sediminicola]ULG70400.1 helix-turn-helix domain-containing protein [Marinobacterium sediminicola]SMR69483.1 Helix-turn-helix domain-containing protein [Marinobacterium sediminicola]